MSALMLGFTKSVLDRTLCTLQPLIEEQAKLGLSAHRNLVFITGEFQMMYSFFHLADQDEVEDDEKIWLRQVRELASDIEDCIEVVHLDGRSWWWRLLPLDLAVTEIEQLKTRTEDISRSNIRLLQQPASNSSARATARDKLMEARKTTRRQGFADLTQLITKKDSGHQVIAVWGTDGDLGTRSVMRKAYSDPEICQKFTCRAWVKFVHPFDPHEFIQGLTAQLYENSEKSHDEAIRGFLTISEATQGDHVKDFLRHLKEVKYLIVLEDLSSQAEWSAVRTFLPDTKNGSSIILSTQQFEIATLCVGQPFQPLELKQFSTDHSVCALIECSESDGDKAEEILENHEVPDIMLTSKTNAAKDWMMKYPIIGRESEIRELHINIVLARRKKSQVIPVWGISGVGKSALVKKVFCDKIVTSRLFQKYGWVDVSHPFNLRDLARSLFSDFHSESLQPNGKIRTGNPIQDCREFLQQHRCLVIIDDLQSKEEWDLIKAALLSGSSRSFIVAITTEVNIATHCTDKENIVFNVKGLDADAAFDLFHQEVMRKNPFYPLKDLKEDVKLHELIVKCGGLPKVLVEIAGVLAEKTTALTDTICSTTNRFMDTLQTDREYHSLEALFDWMHSYFCHCPDLLKPCIFYISLFPPYQSIRRRRVVRRLVAEGYSKDSEDLSGDQIGEMLFDGLVDLSIIQHPTQPATTLMGDTRMSLCRVNGFFREYIISRQMEENFVFELDTSCNLTTQSTGRHLIIRERWDRNETVFNNIDFSRLRSLTVFGGWKSFFISKSMTLLRVLDLEDASGVEYNDLKDMVKLLSCLKFLSLRGCHEICSLPSSLGDLRKLQTLDVRHTSIVTLPFNITKLQKLQYIRAGTTAPAKKALTPHHLVPQLSNWRSGRHLVGVVVPPGIGKLTALHTLGVVNVSASGTKAVLEDLKKLTHLRKLGVSGINKNNSNKFFLAISVLVHLETLSVRLEDNNKGCLDDIPLPLGSLRSLKLHGLGGRLPNWLEQLTMLSKVDLEIAKLTEDHVFPHSEGLRPEGRRETTRGVIKFLSELPGLCILRLCVDHLQDNQLDVSIITNNLEEDSFKKMKIFEIACTSQSSSKITFGEKTMKKLEQLKVDCCSGSLFFGLKHLPELREVLLKGSSDESLKADLIMELENHPKENKPVVNMENFL